MKMYNEETGSINLEQMFLLAREDPEEFDRQSRAMIKSEIQRADEDQRLMLEQLQFCIDGELRKYKNPVARMNRMVELFWPQVMKFHDALQGRHTEESLKVKNAHVLSFNRKV